jgi:hypothetical protein
MVSTEPQTCRLCRESRTLVESHILPEFLYKPTYDERHSSIYLDVDSEQTGTRRRGFWEILFCEECEERFNRWETYFAEIWFNRSVRPPFSLARNRFLTIRGIDYRKFKLFHLSIIWRAGISSLRPFRGVRLGGQADALRCLISADNPGPLGRYPIAAIALQDDDGGYKDDIIQLPRPGKYKGHHFCSAVFGGVHWTYGVSGHSSGSPFPSTLGSDGTLRLAVQRWSENRAVLDLAAVLQRLGPDLPRGPTV